MVLSAFFTLFCSLSHFFPFHHGWSLCIWHQGIRPNKHDSHVHSVRCLRPECNGLSQAVSTHQRLNSPHQLGASYSIIHSSTRLRLYPTIWNSKLFDLSVPCLVSHNPIQTELLFYIVMLKRCLILESSRHSRLIQIIGIILILVRFADWPYELTFHNIQAQMEQPIESGQTCWATWGSGVLILNFIGDTLANLFLSGLFVRRLFKHLKVRTNMIVNQRSQLVEYIARKSLVCLILTFLVNLTMNLFKLTSFLGDRSDAFTPLFEIIESTLLVEALRVDHENLQSNHFCESCGFIIAASTVGDGTGRTRRKSSIVRVLSGSQLKDMSPTLNEVSKPEESFTVNMNSVQHDRHELHHRPEWNNNDYRMF